ncbi:MAG: hypothetical protein IT580_24125, partial [Verrucomicrobiales bacterium]|nr:hypothetical protein [Verrucomicrobiales bacterium]
QLRKYEDQRLEEQKSLNSRGILGVQRESDRLFSAFPGPAWYRRNVTIPAEWSGKIPWLRFAGVHREAEVWIAGRSAATPHSYLTPFQVDLSPFAKPGETVSVVVRVDARRNRDRDPLMGCLDTLDFLYVTWGGIHRPVTLEATERTRLAETFVIPQLASSSAEIRVTLEGPTTGKLRLRATVRDADHQTVAALDEPLPAGRSDLTLPARFAQPRLWSPRSPHLYTAHLQLLDGDRELDTRTVRFGMRELKTEGGRFLLNGRPIFLRGYGDDCIFPNTICPPTDKEEFRRRLSIARDYGFNYVRHHSWTPPEEYFEAADELGMMLQPEFPFAYQWDLPTAPEARRAALDQWAAMIRQHRNHPSIVAWCMGNEQYDSFDLAPEMYATAKRLDPTRLVIDSDGCGFKHQGRSTLDFLVVQFNEGSSIGFQDGKYAFPSEPTKPVIAHEMGYFVTLPDLRQLDLFQNGIRPYWLLQTRDLAARNGQVADYPDWLAASYRLQAASLKCNQEAARRSRLSGTSVWLFQDYPNCAEGVVDMFHRPKGVSAEEFRRFNSPTVLLLDTPRRSWKSGETAPVTFLVSRFEEEPTDHATLRWTLRRGTETVAEGSRKDLRVEDQGVQELLSTTLELPRRDQAERLTLTAELEDAHGRTLNAWDLWLFPTNLLASPLPKISAHEFPELAQLYPGSAVLGSNTVPTDTALLVTTRWNDDILDYLNSGGRVLLLEPEPVFAVEKTNFRLSSWDGGGPSGTVIETRHPALRAMPSEGWCDLQFYPLIQGSKTIQLSALPAKIPPLIRCIDRPTRLADRAYVFEVAVGRGKLLVSGFNVAQALRTQDPAAVFLLDQWVRYALGPDFHPATSLP